MLLLMKPVTRLALTLLPFVLSACGWVPLPEQRANDFRFTNSSVRPAPGQVAYMIDDQLALSMLDLPPLPYRSVTLDARLSYAGQIPLQLEIFASSTRPECPTVESTLPGYGPALLCPGPAGGQVVGEVVLEPGGSTAIHLEGPALDQALRAGRLYLGLRLLGAQPAANELIYVSGIRFNARL
jgi:hypothetical protein